MSGHVHAEVDHCELPRARRKYSHRLWVCDCGQAWIARLEYTWAGTDWVWKRWGKRR